MVAFGKKLAAAAAEAPFDAAHYLDYESLKALLYDLQPLHLAEDPNLFWPLVWYYGSIHQAVLRIAF